MCRIMEFLHVRSDDPTSPIDSLRVNWYYRPRDVQRFNSDSRLVYGTMHSDMCPIVSLRGKCTIKHRSEIADLDAYRKERDSFYFVQIFDRFIRRWYECIPVGQIINVPERVKKALDERWKFVVVEIGRVKELTSAVKTCKRCARYCASNDSVDCAICKNSYHMNCVQPPLPKKPSRGFAWACGPCSRASEKKLDARNTPTVSGNVTEAEEEEYIEEEQPSASNGTTRAPSPSGSDMVIDDHPATQAEMALAKMWPMRYLGIHCRVEDALQYDDRAIYPRASSRLGPRHQANVNIWHGRPVELVKPAEIKKRYNKGNSHKKDGKLTKETIAALEADREERAKRPKWVMDEPPGYVARGDDYPRKDPHNTAELMFKMPPQGEHSERGLDDKPSPIGREDEIEEYLKRAKTLARGIGVPPFGCNFLDKALGLLTDNNYNQEAALKELQKCDRVKDLHEPVFTKAELVKFEEGVSKYGSEHRLVRLHMKTTLPTSDIVRFYYLWKKTPKGREIWGNFGGRKGAKRKVDDVGAKMQQSVANDGDDSAFDNDKAVQRNKGFQCKFCSATHSRHWRRAPGVSPGQMVVSDGRNGKEKGAKLLLALCLRCAGLWRKYAIQWEDIDEVAKKVAQGGGRAWKRRIDEELLRELVAANEAASVPAPDPATGAVPSIEMTGEPPKKKSKMDGPLLPEALKKAQKPPPPPKEPTPPPPPIIPNQPQWKVLPCAVCKAVGDTIACSHCNLTVHRQCFGVGANDGLRLDGETKWVCEQCSNDRNPQVSTDYACCLCLTEETLIDLVEPPKVSHKKKTDREREKERMEKELADGMRAEYRSKQLALNRPQFPREPLKRTTGNNWVHIYCAVWTPEIRFSDAKKLEVAEGFQQILPSRHDAVCKLCKNKDHQNHFRGDKGACVSCLQCHANFHASCAFEAGYMFGFDITPVKGSRKDQVTTATLADETGSLLAAIWCKEHVVKTTVHPMNEIADAETGKTALQVFVENYKQADLNLTGTVRKANLAQLTKEKGQLAVQPATNGNRRESVANSIAAAVRRGARTSSAAETKSETEDVVTQLSDVPEALPERRCVKCKIDVTPRWHPLEQEHVSKEPTPPKSPLRRMSMTLGEIADLERERSGIDMSGAPISRPPPQHEMPRQNIRFMPPGASGRAWDGMPDRYTPRPTTNGAPHTPQQPLGGPPTPTREATAPDTNGEPRVTVIESSGQDTDDGYHNHALPHYQNPASALTPPLAEVETGGESPVQEYLCHKCFVKKKLDPTPPPAERPTRSFSPATQFSVSLGWSGSGGPPSQPAFDHSQPLRMPWDDPPPQNQPPPPPPPPPHVNGLGLSNFGQPPAPPPPQAPNYPPYGQQQPNGYHAPPPPPPHSHIGPVPPPMHERHSSFGYGGPPPVSNPPPYPQHPPSRPSPLQVFAPPHQHIPNGLTSPHTQQHQPPLQSPTHPSASQYHGYDPRRTESPFTSHLPPMGQPGFVASSPHPPARPDLPPNQPPQYHVPQQQQYASPQASQVRPESQAGRPATPRDGQSQGTPTLSAAGASASPNLRNLLS